MNVCVHLQPNQFKVFGIVMIGMGIAALPFAFKSVRKAEARVHEMREVNIDAENERKAAKEMSRESRLKGPDVFRGIRERKD